MPVQLFDQIRSLVERGEIRISAHGYDELMADTILARDIIDSIREAKVVEVYEEYHKGPCLLALHQEPQGNPIHVVWGIPKNANIPAVLITAYRPDPKRWSDDFMRRVP